MKRDCCSDALIAYRTKNYNQSNIWLNVKFFAFEFGYGGGNSLAFKKKRGFLDKQKFQHGDPVAAALDFDFADGEQ